MRACHLVVAICTVFMIGGNASAARVPSELKGCWVVTQELKTPNTSGLSQPESDRLLGRTICFSASSVTSGSEVVEHVNYREVELSDAEFFRQFHFLPLKALGISASRVLLIDVAGEKGEVFAGDTVLVEGKRRIIEYMGVFFELAGTPPGCSLRRAARPTKGR